MRGWNQAQAEAIAVVSMRAFNEMLAQGDLATKKDLDSGLYKLKEDLICWMFGMFTGFAAFFVAVMAWLK